MTIIFYFETLLSKQYAEIKGEFKLCNVNSNLIMLNLNSNCFRQSPKQLEKYKKNFTIKRVDKAYVFSKHNFLLETVGTECKMLIRKYRFSKDLLFNRFVQNDIEEIRLSKHDCYKMFMEKKCGDLTQSFDMQCNGNNNKTCWFRQNIVQEFPFYFGTIEKHFFECHLSEKIVYAQNKNQNIFHNSIRPCFAEDGVCLLPQSTIIWNTNEIRNCPYERLIHLNDLEYAYVETNDLIVTSESENYLFKLEKKINECDIEFYSTSEGLYLSFYYGNKELKSKLENLAVSKYPINHFIDRDKHDLMIAEEDYVDNHLFNQIEQLQCSMLINSIRQSLYLEDKFILLNKMGNFK